jgi:hypothetical protein
MSESITTNLFVSKTILSWLSITIKIMWFGSKLIMLWIKQYFSSLGQFWNPLLFHTFFTLDVKIECLLTLNSSEITFITSLTLHLNVETHFTIFYMLIRIVKANSTWYCIWMNFKRHWED